MRPINPLYQFGMFAAVCLLATGCGQTPTADNAGEIPATTNASVVAAKATGESSQGCCGGCAESSTPDGKSDQGCCGGCAESAVKTSKSADSCEDCPDCADGDSSNCKCASGETSAVKAPKADKACCGQCAGEQSVAKDAAPDKTDASVKSFAEDRETFHFLLSNHEKINRNVKELPDGVETLTESSDSALVPKIQEHVASMYQRVEDVRPIRMRDPLYREIFKHADKIEMKIENTESGIRVTETSDDEYVVRLIQEHAKVVSGFVKRGFEEARENHEPPKR